MGGLSSGVSVVVPTLNAGHEIHGLISSLVTQELAPCEILVVDSQSDDNTVEVARALGARVIEVSREEYDHGTTRHDALLQTSGDVVCFMTQDARPADSRLLANLVAPLADPTIAASYARQRPLPESPRHIQLMQELNYPPYSHVRSASSIRERGIKAFFFSNVCAAYRRSDYLELGGFERQVGTNEDMLMCARMLRSGKCVAYAADAVVWHSNRFSVTQQFERDRAIGRFLAEHADELGPSELAEGARTARQIASTLLREHEVFGLAAFGLHCAVRLAGNRVGRFEIEHAWE